MGRAEAFHVMFSMAFFRHEKGREGYPMDWGQTCAMCTKAIDAKQRKNPRRGKQKQNRGNKSRKKQGKFAADSVRQWRT